MNSINGISYDDKKFNNVKKKTDLHSQVSSFIYRTKLKLELTEFPRNIVDGFFIGFSFFTNRCERI